MNETVRRFLPMVDFLEQVLGKNSEIVLHDFSDPDHAIVDIRNGIVSGRKVGGPATDLALKIMHDPKYRDLPFITGYEGRGAGGKTLESATYFIRENDEIVGMLCVNTDLSTVRSINAMAQQLMACFDAVPSAGGACVYRSRKPFGVHTGAHRPQHCRVAERARAGCSVAWSERPRGCHSPPQRQRGVHAQGRRGLRRHRAGHLGAQRLPLPAKSSQGGLTSKMERGSTSDPSLDKRPCSSHALQGLFACHV